MHIATESYADRADLHPLEPVDYRALRPDRVLLDDRTPRRDPVDELGDNVAAIVRAAHEAAVAIQATAEGELAEAVRFVEEAQEQAAQIVEEARDEAMRIRHDAEVRAALVQAEAERRGREHAMTTAQGLIDRVREAAQVHEMLLGDLRSFLADTGSHTESHTDSAGLPEEVWGP